MRPYVHPDLIAEMQAGALAYSRADRSDPFAYARAMSHIANGVCTLPAGKLSHAERERFPNGKPPFYTATEGREMRPGFNGGPDYAVTVYRNVARP